MNRRLPHNFLTKIIKVDIEQATHKARPPSVRGFGFLKTKDAW